MDIDDFWDDEEDARMASAGRGRKSGPPIDPTAPSAPASTDLSEDDVRAALQDAWDTYVGDTGCFPEAFRMEGDLLFADFSRGPFAGMVAECLRSSAPASTGEAETLIAAESQRDEWQAIALALRDDLAAAEARAQAAEQEVDRFRRGWGPTTPTERGLRREDLWTARNFLDHIYGSLVELNPNNYTHDDVEEANAGTIAALLEAKLGQAFLNDRLAKLAESMTGQIDEGMAALETRVEEAERQRDEALAKLEQIIEVHDEWAKEAGFDGIDDPLTEVIEDARALSPQGGLK